MTANTCSCCDGQHESTDRSSQPRILTGPEPLEVTLPEELRTALGRFFDRDSVPTLAAWARTVRRQVGGDLTVDELCTTDRETGHWGTVGGDRQQFLCFYDAVILAALSDQPVDIHTESPEGTVIEARANGTETLDVTPESAVFSVGIERETVEGDPSLEDAYAAICPYVKAFPDEESYRQWASTVSAATVGLELDGATEFAAALLAVDG